jgi:hypothetical protein
VENLLRFKGAIFDLKLAQERQSKDPTGSSVLLPVDTSQPRNCLEASNPCHIKLERPDIGFTYETASIPLNDQVAWFTRIAENMNNLAIAKKVERHDAISLDNPIWELLAILADQATERLNTINLKMLILLKEAMETNFHSVKALFVLTLVVSIIAVAIFYLKSIPFLLDRILALTAL